MTILLAPNCKLDSIHSVSLPANLGSLGKSKGFTQTQKSSFFSSSSISVVVFFTGRNIPKSLSQALSWLMKISRSPENKTNVSYLWLLLHFKNGQNLNFTEMQKIGVFKGQ